jgi:hypothetical protein
MDSHVSFEKGIVPVFRQYRAPTMWRFDPTRHDDVNANARAIGNQISSAPVSMPLPPFLPLPAEQIALFNAWMNGGFGV